MRQGLSVIGVHKSKYFRLGAESSDQALLGRYTAPNDRKDILSDIQMVFQNLRPAPAKQFRSSLLQMIRHELPQLVDDRDGVDVALPLSLTPREQPVSAKNN